MMNIGIINFNSACFTEKMLNFENLETINLDVLINDKSCLTLSAEELFEKADKEKTIPKTTQPITGEIVTVYRRALEKYDEIIILTPNKDLSGTHQNAVLSMDFLEENEQKRMHIVETLSFALSEAIICDKAIDLINQKMELEQIIENLNQYALKVSTYIIPGDFNYLRKSGRVNLAQLIVGKMMLLKLLVIHDGKNIPSPIAKARGFKKLLGEITKVLDEHADNIEKIYLAEILPNLAEKEELLELFKKRNIEVIETVTTSVIMAAHFGPQSLGFSIITK